MDSLIYLDKWCSSLPIILKLLWLMGWLVLVVVMMNGWGVLQVLFVSFTKGLGGFFPMYSSSQVRSPTLVPIDGITLGDHGVFVLGETRRFLMVLPPLKWVWIPYLPTDLFWYFHKDLVCRVWTMWSLLLTSLVAAGVLLAPWLLAPSMASLEDLFEPFSPPCPKPTWDICIEWELSWGVLFLVWATQDCCTQFWPYGRGCW